jgi:hypothetical protein
MAPVYEYECPRGHKFEKRVPIDQMDELQPCEGSVVEVDRETGHRVHRCRAPAKRLEVPSTPPHVIIH